MQEPATNDSECTQAMVLITNVSSNSQCTEFTDRIETGSGLLDGRHDHCMFVLPRVVYFYSVNNVTIFRSVYFPTGNIYLTVSHYLLLLQSGVQTHIFAFASLDTSHTMDNNKCQILDLLNIILFLSLSKISAVRIFVNRSARLSSERTYLVVRIDLLRRVWTHSCLTSISQGLNSTCCLSTMRVRRV